MRKLVSVGLAAVILLLGGRYIVPPANAQPFNCMFRSTRTEIHDLCQISYNGRLSKSLPGEVNLTWGDGVKTRIDLIEVIELEEDAVRGSATVDGTPATFIKFAGGDLTVTIQKTGNSITLFD